jgi:hypothetical protein
MVASGFEVIMASVSLLALARRIAYTNNGLGLLPLRNGESIYLTLRGIALVLRRLARAWGVVWGNVSCNVDVGIYSIVYLIW